MKLCRMARKEGQGQSPRRSQDVQGGERKRRQREKSKKSRRHDDADISEQEHFKDNSSTRPHAVVAQWYEDGIWQLGAGPFQLGKSNFMQMSVGVIFQ